MLKLFLTGFINLLATLVSAICRPLNILISIALPDLTEKIMYTTNGINSMFNSMNWALGLIPPNIKEVLLFILLCEIARHSMYLMSHAIVKIWNLIQKLKFW